MIGRWAGLLLCLAPMSAIAAECAEGSNSVLVAKNWTARAQLGGAAVSLGYTTPGEKIIRVAHATAYFYDGLGDLIGEHKIRPDEVVIPRVESGDDFQSADFDRLRYLRKTEVDVVICTTGVIYSDGTKQKF